MNRTKGRPLPSGRIMPPANALLLAAVLLFAGFLLSYLLLNLVATLFIILGATIYISLYTILLKPRTTWNIVLGGSAGSCAALAGWYSVTFSDPLAAGVLAAIIFACLLRSIWSLGSYSDSSNT